MSIKFELSAQAVVFVMRAPLNTLSAVVTEILFDNQSLKAKQYTELLAIATARAKCGADVFEAMSDEDKALAVDACKSSAKVYAEKGARVAAVAADKGLDVGLLLNLADDTHKASAKNPALTKEQKGCAMVRAWLALLDMESMKDITEKLLGMSTGRTGTKTLNGTDTQSDAPTVTQSTPNAGVISASQAETMAARLNAVIAGMSQHEAENLALQLLTIAGKTLGQVAACGAVHADALDTIAARETLREVAASKVLQAA